MKANKFGNKKEGNWMQMDIYTKKERFSYKDNAHYKVRLMVKGYAQKEIVYYN